MQGCCLLRYIVWINAVEDKLHLRICDWSMQLVLLSSCPSFIVLYISVAWVAQLCCYQVLILFTGQLCFFHEVFWVEENDMLFYLPKLGHYKAILNDSIYLFARYVALNMLMRAINFDAQAVQRHRATILECVKVFSTCFWKLFFVSFDDLSRALWVLWWNLSLLAQQFGHLYSFHLLYGYIF